MKNVRLVQVGEVLKENRKKDKKINREYFKAEFVDATNPFAVRTISRNFFQRHSPDGTKANWGGLNYNTVKSLLGKVIPGEIVTEKVQEYEIKALDGSGKVNKVDTFTTVILPGENKETVFNLHRHPIVTEATSDFAVEPVLAEVTTETVN